MFVMPNALRPDVTFGEHNDRFDVTSLIRRQKKLFDENPMDPQSEEYRRKGDKSETKSWLDVLGTKRDKKKLRKALIQKIEDHANQIANILITRIRSLRRFDGDFAYHDLMASDGTDAHDYDKNLDRFHNVKDPKKKIKPSRRLQDVVHRLHGQRTRIVMEPENEILLHYALPVRMKIEGFLQAPANK